VRNVTKLPDAYRKTEDSNNNKLLSLQEYAVKALIDDLSDIQGSLNLDTATGKTLDLYGEMVGQKRGALTDEQYRLLIKAKISASAVGSDLNSIINAMCLLFNAEPSDVSISETDNVCEVEIVKLPLAVLLEAGFTSTQAVEIVKTLIPICISVVANNFEGTFEFSATADEASNTAGFADDAQTVGGYFGMLYGEDSDTPPLPI